MAEKDRESTGQGLTEYIVILAIVAIGTIPVIGLFGKQIKGVFTGIAGSLADKKSQQDDKGFNDVKTQVKRAGMDTQDEPSGGEKSGGGAPWAVPLKKNLFEGPFQIDARASPRGCETDKASAAGILVKSEGRKAGLPFIAGG